MDDKEFLKMIGLKMKIFRNLRGFSQDFMANSLDIDKSYYSKIERGQANATILYLKHIAELLEIPTEKIVNGEIDI